MGNGARHNSIDVAELNEPKYQEKVNHLDTLMKADARRSDGKKKRTPRVVCLHFVEKYAVLLVGFIDQVVRVYTIFGLGQGQNEDCL